MKKEVVRAYQTLANFCRLLVYDVISQTNSFSIHMYAYIHTHINSPLHTHTHTHTQLPTHTPTPAHLHRDTQHSKFARCVMGRHAFNRQKCFKYSTRKCCWVPAKGKKTVYRWRREGASWGPRAACLTDLFNDTFMGSSHKLEFYVFWIECK